MIAVTGATGQLGRLVIKALVARGAASQIVALARNPDKSADLGVPARAFDYSRPETLAPALQGVDTLLLISGSEAGQRAAQHANVIAAAKQAGVQHIVYTSLLHADISPISLAEEHRQTEADLAASGLAVTILRNGWYTENYTRSLKGAVANGAVAGSVGNGKLATASRADLAEAAANVVLAPAAHAGRTYELAGAPYTLGDLAAETARQSGSPVAYNDLPQADYAELLEGVGLPVPAAKMIASADAAAAKGALFDDSGDLETLLGRPATPLSEAVRTALAA